jgi:hypothetical protein
MECSLAQANDLMHNNHRKENYTTCYPWYFSLYSIQKRICDPWEANEFLSYFQNVNHYLACPLCLPDCKHTLYKHKINIEPIQICEETNFGVSNLCNFRGKSVLADFWGKQALDDLDPVKDVFDPTNPIIYVVNLGPNEQSNVLEQSYLKSITTSERSDKKFGANLFSATKNTYESYQKDVTYLNIYFDQSSALQFRTQASSNWIEYFANVGGVLGLFIGLSIVTVFEIIWILIRITASPVKDNLNKLKGKLNKYWSTAHLKLYKRVIVNCLKHAKKIAIGSKRKSRLEKKSTKPRQILE